MPLPPYFSNFYEVSLYGRLSPELKAIGSERFPLYSKMAEWAPCLWGPMHLSGLPDAILRDKPYPIKALLVFGGNPSVQYPNAKDWEDMLKKLEFVVVCDLFKTSTVKLADIILPAAWWLEKTDLSEQWPLINYVLLRQRVMAQGKCWPEEEIIFKLAKRLGLEKDFPWRNVEGVIDDIFKPLSVEKLKENPSGMWIEKDIIYKKYEKEGFATPSGKMEIYSKELERAGYDPLPVYYDYLEVESQESGLSKSEIERKYPLILTKHNSYVYLHSQFRNIPLLRQIEPEPLVEIHPQTAKEMAVNDGDWVVVESARGSIKAKVQITNRAHLKVVFMVHGWEEANINALITSKVRAPIPGSPPTRECRVRIGRIL